MSNFPKDMIDASVGSLLDYYWKVSNVFPIDLNVLIEEHNAVINYVVDGPVGELCGLFQREDAPTLNLYNFVPKIFFSINSNMPITRQRFTLAHIFDHHVLHKHTSRNRFVETIENFQENPLGNNKHSEMEANYFAACLLIPECFVDEEFSKVLPIYSEDIEHVAKRYGVSDALVKYRLNVHKHSFQIIP